MYLLKSVLGLCLLVIGTTYGVETLNAPSTNLTFPREIVYKLQGEEQILHATGVATRSKFFINVYSVAHYMRHPIEGRRRAVFDEILHDNQMKQLTLKWVRDVDLKRMREGLNDSLDKILKQQPADVEEERQQFFAFFDKPIESGDEHIIRWLPGGIIEVEINGQQKGTIENPEFARAVWSIWFGPKSVVSRNRLVSQLRGN